MERREYRKQRDRALQTLSDKARQKPKADGNMGLRKLLVTESEPGATRLYFFPPEPSPPKPEPALEGFVYFESGGVSTIRGRSFSVGIFDSVPVEWAYWGHPESYSISNSNSKINSTYEEFLYVASSRNVGDDSVWRHSSDAYRPICISNRHRIIENGEIKRCQYCLMRDEKDVIDDIECILDYLRIESASASIKIVYDIADDGASAYCESIKLLGSRADNEKLCNLFEIKDKPYFDLYIPRDTLRRCAENCMAKTEEGILDFVLAHS